MPRDPDLISGYAEAMFSVAGAEGVLIVVEDAGVGVPPHLQDAIFEPFRQGPQAKSHSPGVGVGLSLVLKFAELHGGRAWVEDREGGGASFRVWLPSVEPDELATWTSSDAPDSF